MTWRDGVHVGDTPIWCDARRRRDVCFVSSADRVGRTGHGQLIGTPLTLALLDTPPNAGHLAVPVRQRFTLGTVRLELVPSGRGPGAAALHADVAGKRVLYAGAIRTATAEGIEAGEVRACNAVVVAAPHAAAQAPPLGDAIAQTIAWTQAQLAGGRHPVLLVDGMLEGLEVAGCLRSAGVPVTGGRALREAVKRVAATWPELAPVAAVPPLPRTRTQTDRTQPLRGRDLAQLADDPPAQDATSPAVSRTITPQRQIAQLAIATPGREPRAIVWLASDRTGLTRALGERPHALARLAWPHAEGAADVAIAWPFAADRAQLLAWIESTGAREVYVTGAAADAIVTAIGATARVLGPPHQMALFRDEAS